MVSVAVPDKRLSSVEVARMTTVESLPTPGAV
jgi:hypothetical protein